MKKNYLVIDEHGIYFYLISCDPKDKKNSNVKDFKEIDLDMIRESNVYKNIIQRENVSEIYYNTWFSISDHELKVISGLVKNYSSWRDYENLKKTN